MSGKIKNELELTDEEIARATSLLNARFAEERKQNTSLLDKGMFGTQSDVKRRAYDAASMSYDDFLQGDTYEDLAKRYSEKGKMAMDDTIGKVAARTGGIASSYATQAGQQAYGDWMTRLEETARAMYDSERQEAMDRYTLSKDVLDMRNSAEDRRLALEDRIRKQYQENDDRAATAADAIAKDSSEEIMVRLAAGESLDDMSDLIEKSGRSAAYWNAYATLPTSDTNEPEEETVAPSYKYAYSGDKGTVYHDQYGKEVTVQKGYNPYTRTRNPDIGANGDQVMDNGYQPDNINGEKLRLYQGGTAITEDGSELTIYVLGGHDSMANAGYYVWDDFENKYHKLTPEEMKMVGIS